MRVLVLHRLYGCWTGCCGHYVDIDGEEVPYSFDFCHPEGEDIRKFAEDLVKEAGCDPNDIAWDDCIITDSC